MAYEVYTYGNVEAFIGTFNAIASMMGADSFTGAMHLATLLGAFSVLLYGLFGRGLMVPIQWLLGINLITLVLFAPRTDVIVVDRLSAAPAQVVSGVPFMLAHLAHDITLLGDKLTGLTETAFQVIPDANVALPQSLSYQQNGLMFASRLITESRRSGFRDPWIRTDFVSYVRDCLVPDFNTRYKDPNTFAQSTDLWVAMGDTNPARYTYVGNDVRTCPEAYNNLGNRLPEETGRTLARVAMKLAPGLPQAGAIDKFTADAPDAVVKGALGNAAAEAGALIRQNAIINMLNDSYGEIAKQNNDPASVLMATAEATITAQTNASWITSGKLAESALPKFRGIAQALSYALFPFIIILGLAVPIQMFGKLFVGWLKFMVALELWPPLYAILNYFGTLSYAKAAASAAAFGTGAGGLAVSTASAIYDTAISDQAIIGYISLSIPVISWALVNQMQGIMTAFAAGTAVQHAVHGTAGQMATGNVGMGNVSMDRQALGKSIEESSMFTRVAPQGTTIGSAYGGNETFKQNMSSLASKPAFGESEIMSESRRRAESTQLATSEREAQGRAESAALGHALGIDRQFRASQDRSGGASVGTTGGSGRSTSLASKINDAVDSQFGKDYSSEAKSLIAAKLSTTASAGVDFGIVGAKVQAELMSQGVHTSTDKLKAAYNSTQSAMREQGVSDTTSLLKNFQTDDAYRWAKGSSVAGADKFDSSYQESLQHQRSSEAALTEAKSREKSEQFMRDWNSGVQTDATNYAWQQLRNRGQDQEYQRLTHSDPARAQGMVKDILMDYASFGRTAGNPGPALVPGMVRDGKEWTSDGWKPREDFQAAATQLGGAPAVQAQAKENDGKVIAEQKGAGVEPGQKPKDDVSGHANRGQGNIAKTQSDVAVEVKGKRQGNVGKYRQETSPDNTSIWHGMDAPNGARTRVVDEEKNKPNEVGATGRTEKVRGGANGKW
ncbi:MAG: conjugal transfer protein TraG N-terminal domain-containing protein [Pseudomonadota bacterium]|nr:conjugal transfer protein TraG N-terminal domain-containing protein [Pseudomonadota bacterium]